MTTVYEAEVIIGIEDIAIKELQTLDGMHNRSIKHIRDGFIRFEYSGKRTELDNFRSIIAIYEIHHFDIPRPKAILGHQNFTRLVDLSSSIINTWDNQEYTLGLGAAGSDSSVMQRIKSELSQALNLPIAEEEKGNLYLRLIPAYKKTGWEALIRLTPAPLSTRSWRIKNIPGALNATVAYAMLQLANIKDETHVINLCSGTATILIELAHQHKRCNLLAIDNDCDILNMATTNITASHTQNRITQICAEAQQTPTQTGSIQYIFADLPFGHHIGSHEENEWLYPAILDEAARITAQGAIFVALTHEIQLMELSLRSSQWAIKHQRKINLSGLHPQIFVLERI